VVAVERSTRSVTGRRDEKKLPLSEVDEVSFSTAHQVEPLKKSKGTVE